MLSVSRLTAALVILVKCHPAAIKILTGEHEPPTVLEISEMVSSLRDKGWYESLGCRVDSKSYDTTTEKAYFAAEKYLEIIDHAGGWKHIVTVVNLYIEHNHKYWQIFRDTITWLDKISTSRNGYNWQSDILSEKYGYSKNHIHKIKKKVPRDLAKLMLFLPVGDC